MDELPLLIILLFLSAFFSGAEIALFSLGQAKIHALKKNTKNKIEKKRVARIELLKANPNKLLVTILIGNNIVNIAASAMATVLAIKTAENLGLQENTNAVIGAVTGIMTFLILLFGEILPKSVGHRYALRFALFSAPILLFLQLILAPLVWPLSKLVEKISADKDIKRSMSEDELKAAIELSEREGKIEHEEKELVEKALEFDQHSVKSIMTPRAKIFGLEDDTFLEKALEEIKTNTYTRIPIYHEEIDQITGVLTIHTLLKEITEKGINKSKVANLSLFPPFKIPPTMKISTLLKEFQKKKIHIAFIYDEHGGLIGLITMEDILEEIVGEIRDEEDEEEEHKIKRIGKYKFICNSEVELEHIENFMKERMKHEVPENFPWKIKDENKTLSYFLLEQFERFPEKGESIKIGNDDLSLVFSIAKIDGEQIKEVEVKIQ